tara:strand:+ start:13134 stop:14237 length:1104 start_codon:yes stop_codon:yes gene_type:complete
MALKKKIAFIIGGLSSGGAERIISNLSNKLIDNYEVIIITFKKSEPFYKLNPDVNIIYCMDKIIQPKNIFDSLKLNYTLIKKTIQILKFEKINLAIGFITSANIITVISSKIIGIPSIISERNNPIIEDVPKFWRILRTLVYPKANYIVLQTNGIKDYYSKKIMPSKIGILPNPISQELSNERNLDSEKKNIILSVGRLTKNKCHSILINAISEIDIHDWEVVIVGNGEYKSNLEALITELKLEHKIKLIEATNEISKYYNLAKIFVFTSRTEGFPNALLEAMHYGLPCISTDCLFGPADLINNGKNGYLIPVNDKDKLKEHLISLIESKELRMSLGAAAIKTTEKYDATLVQQKWIAVIERFINSK